MNGRRGLLGRAFDICVLTFVGALLMYVAVQLIEGIKWWLLSGLALVVIGSLAASVIRYHRDHW